MAAAQTVHDHVMHFYHLHALDWVDIASALGADPQATAQLANAGSGYARSSPGYFADMQKRLKRFFEAGQLGIFANGYWGHPAYKLPPEVNLLAMAHFLDALEWQRDVARLQAVFGGKNPHPNLIVGGMPCAISVESGAKSGDNATAVTLSSLALVREIIGKMQSFVEQVYLPDVLAIAGYYKEWAEQGEGLGNFMTYGDYPAGSIYDPDGFLIPGGVVLGRNLKEVRPVDLHANNQIQEFIAHSWYDYSQGKTAGMHPYVGETTPAYSGPTPPYEHLDTEQSYSWLKSPRWNGKAMEVGPLARIVLLLAHGHEPTRDIVQSSLGWLALPQSALFSTLGRTLARAIESRMIADAMTGWHDQLLANIKAGDLKTVNASRWEKATWPAETRGVGFVEAPRGAQGPWRVIENGKIANYQAVVPSTWNAGPRDGHGQDGAYEAALKGHHLHDPKQPIEILRTVHSFDPCIACAVHVVDPDGAELIQVEVR
jgi:hydrogenase large subunit